MRRPRKTRLSSEIWKLNLLISASSIVLAVAFVVLMDDLDVFGERIALSLVMRVLVGLAVITFCTILSRHVTDRMCASLRALSEGTHQIEQGNFKVQVVNRDPDSDVGALISNFNHMARELDGIELFRRDFINNFSHEFKTPIASIAGFAERLKNESLPPEKRQEYIDIIIGESRRLTALSSNILLLSKYENQSIVPEREEYALDEQLRLCILSMQEAWTEKNLELDIDLHPVTILGNADMLAQVWNNLIGNAVKFTPEGGSVRVACRKEAERCIVEVEDTGVGMSPETQEHIFDKFYQGDTSHKLEGNGLGLPIVHQVVKLCGGELFVESREGEGSLFRISLPIHAIKNGGK